jgi:hypothetical protein
MEHVVVGPSATLERARISGSIIGGHAKISDVSGSLLVTDHAGVTGNA